MSDYYGSRDYNAEDDAIRRSTLYDSILAFDTAVKTLFWLVEPHRHPWHDAGITAMLKAQAHFVCTRAARNKISDALYDDLNNTYLCIDPPALREALTLPFPVIWFEVDEELTGNRRGFAVERLENPWRLKLYTFQQKAHELPLTVALHTTMNEFLHDDLNVVRDEQEYGDWLPPSALVQGKIDMFDVIDMMLIVGRGYKTFDWSQEAGTPEFARNIQIETDMDKVAAANRSGVYPFYELAGLWEASQRPRVHPSSGTPPRHHNIS